MVWLRILYQTLIDFGKLTRPFIVRYMARKIPIFITTYDRIEVLQQSMESYYHLGTEIEIIIHDQGSTFPPMIEYLKHLERKGFKVYRGVNEPTSVRTSIADWYKTNNSKWYVVTDPDISLRNTHPNMLNICIDLLALEKDVTCVGPALKIDDLPDHYPMKAQVIKWEKQWYKEENKKAIRINNDIINYHFSVIDTTFAVYRKGHEFTKPNVKAIRVGKPYEARHLDWYIDHRKLTGDYKHYIGSAKKSGQNRTHWSSKETSHK
jgi:hypothetical protein